MPLKFRTKRPKRGRLSSLSRPQAAQVRQIAKKTTLALAETINKVDGEENLNLFHNLVIIKQDLLSMKQGTADDNTSSTKLIRKGDEILLKNVNIRFWLSNKLDRPNVMYKGVLFWYKSGTTVLAPNVFFTATNKMLDRYNTEDIKIIDKFIVKSTNNYAVDANNHEHSYLTTLNKSYKAKKIVYNENGTFPKGWDMGFCVVAYDAFGTLQTDNIGSFAYNMKVSFKDL
jgi:hypothetical protein